MPVSYSVSDSSLTDKDKQVFGEALKLFYGSKLYEDLVQDLDVTIQLKDLGAGVKGDHDTQTGEVRVSPGTGRYQNTPEEMLDTILHELTHSAQKKGRELGLNEIGRSNVFVVNSRAQESLGEKALIKLLSEANMDYGSGEPGAYLGSTMRPGPQTKSPEVQKFIEAAPAFSKEYYRRNAQPQRPVTTHYKAEPEQSFTERMLSRFLDIQSPIN